MNLPEGAWDFGFGPPEEPDMADTNPPMTDPNGWPDARKPGVPTNPERDGWHWVSVTNFENESADVAALWEGGEWWMLEAPDGYVPQHFAELCVRYLGPCLTPAEVAAREQAAAEAMREACAKVVDAHAAAAKRCSEEADVIHRIRSEFLANSYAIKQAADDVRVTPLPTDALDAMLKEAGDIGRAEGWKAGMEVAVKALREKMGVAARLIDCGCANAAEVVKHPPNSARRWELCGLATCAAIQAAAIRRRAAEEEV